MSRPKADMLSFQSAASKVVAELLKHGEMSGGKMAFAWRTVVGEQLARVTTVEVGPHGILQVTAADERWCKELKRSKPMILARLEVLLGNGIVRRLDIASKPPEPLTRN